MLAQTFQKLYIVLGMRNRSLLSKMRVFSMKFLLLRSGVRKPFAQAPACVIEVSWPSLAGVKLAI